jgi:hypothetical protein
VHGAVSWCNGSDGCTVKLHERWTSANIQPATEDRVPDVFVSLAHKNDCCKMSRSSSEPKIMSVNT